LGGAGEDDLPGIFFGGVELVVLLVERLGAEGEEARGLVDKRAEAEADEDNDGDLVSNGPVDVVTVDVDRVLVGFALGASDTVILGSSRTGFGLVTLLGVEVAVGVDVETGAFLVGVAGENWIGNVTVASFSPSKYMLMESNVDWNAG